MAAVLKHPLVFGLRRMFLLVTPNETSFEKLEDVPKYVDEAIPYFIGLILLEALVLKVQGKAMPRLNDSFSSLSHGLLSILHSLMFRSVELASFMWVYERYNIVTLPWDNPLTWILSMLAIDFCYYWIHRFGHAPNASVLWKKLMSRVFYMPLGLFLPPSIYLVHQQFNLIYQFWIHTETIDKLGPLEWILSTPSHHRVHHGRNPYCIDKNYGGIFIFWDMLFGTFQAEKVEEKPVYGLVHNIKTWEPIHGQLCHLKYIVKTALKMEGLSNKVSVFVKGPGWAPGKPRLGYHEDLPQVKPNPKKYDVGVPFWNSAYIWLHYLLMLLFWYPALGHIKESLPASYMIMNIVFIMFSLYVFGSMYDNRPNMDLLEEIRCTVFFIMYHSSLCATLPDIVYWIYVASEVIWIFVIVSRWLAGSKGPQQSNSKMKNS